MAKTIYISGDHAGFKLKEKLKPWLEKKGYSVKDFGPSKYNKEDDYSDFVIPMAKAVSKSKNKIRGIIMAGSGQGEVIAANRIRGARAALFYGGNTNILKLSRAHNNSNILSLGARFLNETQAKKAIDVWLKAKFSNATRHKRRLAKNDKFGSK
jgi:ribose 5-phosphate isomerase B